MSRAVLASFGDISGTGLSPTNRNDCPVLKLVTCGGYIIYLYVDAKPDYIISMTKQIINNTPHDETLLYPLFLLAFDGGLSALTMESPSKLHYNLLSPINGAVYDSDAAYRMYQYVAGEHTFPAHLVLNRVVVYGVTHNGIGDRVTLFDTGDHPEFAKEGKVL
jgi:hypothetical protein